MKPTNTFVTLPKTLDEIVEQCQKRKIFKNLALQLIAEKKKELEEVRIKQHNKKEGERIKMELKEKK